MCQFESKEVCEICVLTVNSKSDCTGWLSGVRRCVRRVCGVVSAPGCVARWA